VYPVTVAGKILGGVIAILGIGLVALPAGIISSGFVSAIGDTNKKTICPHCGKEIE
jgi:voltage-gated potassium channel